MSVGAEPARFVAIKGVKSGKPRSAGLAAPCLWANGKNAKEGIYFRVKISERRRMEVSIAKIVTDGTPSLLPAGRVSLQGFQAQPKKDALKELSGSLSAGP